MDKQLLLQTIKGLEITDEAKMILNDYVEENQNDPELAEKMAKILEAMAGQADMAAEQLNGIIEGLEDYQEKMESQSEAYKDETDKVMEKFQTESMSGVEELNGKYAAKVESPVVENVIPAAPVENITPVETVAAPVQQFAGYGGQQYNNGAPEPDLTTPQPAPFPNIQ